MAALQSLGYGQVWTNVLSSRAVSTVYYNTTSRPIFVAITFNNAGNNVVNWYINGVLTGTINLYGTVGGTTFIVPPGNSYEAIPTTGQLLEQWFELR